MKYRECPFCGCYLDHGERCDCREKEEEQNRKDAKLGRAIDAYMATIKLKNKKYA